MNKDVKNTKSNKVPTDTFETIPYHGVYQNGIIEDYNGRFSRTYQIPDVNFDVQEEDQQEKIVVDYERLINAVDTNMTGQLTVINRNIDPDYVRNNILLKPRNDGLNNYRSEMNAFFSDILAEGHNNMIKEKYWTVSVPAENIIEATDIIKRTDRRVNNALRQICKYDIKPCTIKERLALIYDIYNCHTQLSFDKKVTDYLDTHGDLDLKACAKQSIHSKHLITPDSFEFKKRATYFKLGDDLYGSVLYIDHLPTSLSTSFVNDISNLSCNMVVSVTYNQLPQAVAAKAIKNKLSAINNQINKQQHDAALEGITNSGATSAELENARDATRDLIAEVAQRDQRIFKVTALVAVFASTFDELKAQVKNLQSLVDSHLCIARKLGGMQELALNMCLPLAQDLLPFRRILTTEASCAFYPFSVMDLNQHDGLVYGINPESQNMIRYNRKSGKNYNALILGESGSGKSFIVKEEILQKALGTNEKIIIIDPQGEYIDLARSLGGTVIEVAQNSHLHLNPCDMDIQYGGDDTNPLPAKCEELESLIGVIIGDGLLGPIESNIIHKVGTNMYRGYYKHMQSMVKQGITCDYNAMPTLKDFYTDLVALNEPQAQYLAQAIENYCIGSYAIFSDRTNVDTNARIICYDVSQLKGTLKELGMHVCMTNSMNTMISNGRQGKRTSLYIDEFHLFTRTRSAASAMRTIYKTIRKFLGAPTVITQNIQDMLQNDDAEAILENSSFIVMMNQSPTDRAVLADMYKISSKLLEYITDQSYGHGLIYTGTTLVPFENVFPDNTSVYELLRSQRKDIEQTM